jgi:hypothetical protein
MSGSRAKVKLIYKGTELEIEGSEDFIEKQQASLKEFLLSFNIATSQDYKQDSGSGISSNVSVKENKNLTPEETLKQDFSVWMKAITKSTDDTVSYVIAGYYIQLRTKDNYFTTNEAYQLLYKYGILLRDAYSCEFHNLEIKNIKRVGTIKKWDKLRVCDESVKLLNEIIIGGVSLNS